MTPTEQSILRNLKHELSALLPVRAVVAFGSRARGNADPDSDLDVLVVIDGPVRAGTQETVSACAWRVGLGSGMLVAPVAVSREEWENGPERSSLLALAVAREGVPV